MRIINFSNNGVIAEKAVRHSAITVKEKSQEYLKTKKTCVGENVFKIVEQRCRTIYKKVLKILDDVRKDNKTILLSESALVRYETN